MPRIRPAVPEDAVELTKLVKLAKAHWGYTTAQLSEWCSSLTITPQQLAAQPSFVVEEGSPVGFYTLRLGTVSCDLDNLWVLPRKMGNGYGRALLSHAISVARGLGVEQILIDADPNAESFYLRHGAMRCGSVPAPIEDAQDRVRPQLVLSTMQPISTD